MPATSTQGMSQGVPHMPSIPYADPAAASSSSSAQQAGRPFQSAEMMSSTPILMDSVFTTAQVTSASSRLSCTKYQHLWAGIPTQHAAKLTVMGVCLWVGSLSELSPTCLLWRLYKREHSSCTAHRSSTASALQESGFSAALGTSFHYFQHFMCGLETCVLPSF